MLSCARPESLALTWTGTSLYAQSNPTFAHAQLLHRRVQLLLSQPHADTVFVAQRTTCRLVRPCSSSSGTTRRQHKTAALTRVSHTQHRVRMRPRLPQLNCSLSQTQKHVTCMQSKLTKLSCCSLLHARTTAQQRYAAGQVSAVAALLTAEQHSQGSRSSARTCSSRCAGGLRQHRVGEAQLCQQLPARILLKQHPHERPGLRLLCGPACCSHSSLAGAEVLKKQHSKQQCGGSWCVGAVDWHTMYSTKQYSACLAGKEGSARVLLLLLQTC